MLNQSQVVSIGSDRIRIAREISDQRDVLPLFEMSTTHSVAVDTDGEIERGNEDDRPGNGRIDVRVVNIEITIHDGDLNLLTEPVLML